MTVIHHQESATGPFEHILSIEDAAATELAQLAEQHAAELRSEEERLRQQSAARLAEARKRDQEITTAFQSKEATDILTKERKKAHEDCAKARVAAEERVPVAVRQLVDTVTSHSFISRL